MWSRLKKKDFEKSFDWRVGLDAESDPCWVCDAYNFVELPGTDEEGRPRYRIFPVYPYAAEDKWRQYRPLEDRQDLFIRFARLYRRDRSRETVSAWVHEYGLLGIVTGEDEQGDGSGTSKETTDIFFEEVDRAAAVLAAYEAWLNGDEEAAKQVTRVQFARFTDAYWKEFREQGCMKQRYGGYLGFAHFFAALESEDMARSFANHYTVMDFDTPPQSRYITCWTYSGPLGAMYLQINWLIRAERVIKRCVWCGDVILPTSPPPGAEKDAQVRKRGVRRDRSFCSDSCRQNHHRQRHRRR